ncbi:hypothetical protein OUZ56_005736 [Daphnia magna]|uniref:Uncharacterized protein n=1 Tax=Daphnia magna TaxID=35525 RepID=A0ABQ9YTM6_9CRUS|nr:hypothetical protein OUZ56_005736 [Daphnia magna]
MITYSGDLENLRAFDNHRSRYSWLHSSDHIYHPTPHRSEFYTEITQAEMDNRLAPRQTWNDILTLFNMESPVPEDFHLLRQFSLSLASLLDYVEDQLNKE